MAFAGAVIRLARESHGPCLKLTVRTLMGVTGIRNGTILGLLLRQLANVLGCEVSKQLTVWCCREKLELLREMEPEDLLWMLGLA